MLNLILIAAALAALIDLWRRRKKSGRAALLRSAPGFLILLGATVGFWLLNRDDGFVAKESDYFASQAVVVGEELARDAISGDITLLVLEGEQDTPEVTAFRRELQRIAPDGKIDICPIRQRRPDAPILAERLDATAFAAAFEQTPEDHILISLVGVPAKFKNLDCLRRRRAGGKPFVVIAPEMQPLQQELRQGIVYAAVFPRPDAYFSSTPLSDYRQGFAERYCYINANSI